MANRIRGITVEIGGDTTKLQTALKTVNNTIRNTQTELRDVNRLLKLDPANTELLAQKQSILGKSIDATKEKLETLKTAQSQAEEALRNGTVTQEQYDGLQREIVETEQKLRSLTSQLEEQKKTWQENMAAAGESVKATGEKVTEAGKGLAKYVSVPLMAAGAASVKAFTELDEGYDTIVKKTGAAGEAMESLEQSARNVFGSMPTDMDKVGVAIGEVNTRFKLTGQDLEDLSKSFIQFAEINETDLNGAIGSTNKIMKQFNADSSQTTSVLGMMTAKAQETGISVDTLMSSLQANGGTLKQMGLGLGESIALLAQFEANGVNAGTALAALRKASVSYASAGKSTAEGLTETIGKIKNAKSETEALSIAQSVFGTKGAAEMATAIREGRLSIDDLTGSMSGYKDTVNDTYNGTLDGVDNFKVAMNNLKIALAELGGTISDVAGPILNGLATALKGIAAFLGSLPGPVKTMIVLIGGLLIAIGPVLVVIGTLMSSAGQIMIYAPMISSAISSISGILPALGTAIGGISTPIGLVVAGIAAAIAIGVLLYQNWDTISQVAGDVWNTVCTTVTGVLDSIGSAITGAWSTAYTATTTTFNNVLSFLSGLWTDVRTIITTTVSNISSSVSNTWNNIWSFTSSIFSSVASTISSIWNNITAGISTTVSNVYTTIRNGLTRAFDWIRSIPASALRWGSDIIDGIARGIKSSIGKVGDAAKGVADKIRSFLHFSVPDEGPLTDFESWMPDFMSGLAKGINDSRSLIQGAMRNVSSDMVLSPNAAVEASGTDSAPGLGSITSAINNALAGLTVAQQGDIVIPVYIGESMIDEIVVNATKRNNLRSGGR